MAVGVDDAVFVDDWSGNGVVLDFDGCISNYVTVLDVGNYPDPMVLLSGPCITGVGTNVQIWMADDNTNGSVGVVRWNLTNGVVATNDLGTVVVGITPGGVNLGPYDVSVDGNGNIYTIQCLQSNAAAPRVFRFPPYTGVANLTPAWSVGSPDYSLEYATGIAVSPAGDLVAVAVRGYGPNQQSLQNGAVNIYNAGDGSLVTRLATNDDFTCVAWDHVGNLYAGDYSAAVWRIYSPPGTNYATTPGVPIIQVYDTFTAPLLSEPAILTNEFGFTLCGQSNVTYVIQASSDLTNWVPVATNYAIVTNRYVTLPAPADADFFRAVVPK